MPKAIRKNRLQSQQGGESLTQQSFQREVDINTIMSKYQKTGVVNHIALHSLNYADVTAPDFKTAMDIVTQTTQMFEQLPSTVRREFDHDPVNFLEAVQNPTEHQEVLTKTGLVKANLDAEDVNAPQGSIASEVSTTEPSEGEQPTPQ